MSPGSRIGLVLAAVAVLVGAFVLAKGSDDSDKKDDAPVATAPAVTTATTASGQTETVAPATTTAPPPAPAVPEIDIEGGKPAGGIKKIEVSKGDTVRFKVTSDVADEIHVHGYDLMKDVEAGGSVTFEFKATIDGRYEVELENAGEQIADLRVDP